MQINPANVKFIFSAFFALAKIDTVNKIFSPAVIYSGNGLRMGLMQLAVFLRQQAGNFFKCTSHIGCVMKT
jgi:hypothetical protein